MQTDMKTDLSVVRSRWNLSSHRPLQSRSLGCSGRWIFDDSLLCIYCQEFVDLFILVKRSWRRLALPLRPKMHIVSHLVWMSLAQSFLVGILVVWRICCLVEGIYMPRYLPFPTYAKWANKWRNKWMKQSCMIITIYQIITIIIMILMV